MDFSQTYRRWVCHLKRIVVYCIFCLLISTLAEAESEFVCRSIDIRNSVVNFNQLENCTVIEGHLKVVLIDRGEWWEYQQVSFPKLREITDYLLMYRVFGLKSLSHIFPNLSVIRGQTLFYNYALVMFEMPHIEDIGLVGLSVIERGAVRLEKNSALCYIETINWQLITNVKDEDHFIVENAESNECINVCPKSSQSKTITRNGMVIKQPLCWNYNHSQKVCDPKCGKNGCYESKGSRNEVEFHCCADSCLGGCYGPLDTQCIACKNVVYEGRCQPRCPTGTYAYLKRRCITESQCRLLKSTEIKGIKFKLLNTSEGGKCASDCPSGYSLDVKDQHLCQKCDGPCPKICYPLTIHSVSSAQSLKGCTIIDGILEIEIRGGSHIGRELEENLGMLQEVTEYIKIARSNALISLRFLRNLRLIRGERQYNFRYALFVLDNHNLQDIWDHSKHPKLNIERGKVFFHFNPKLCLNKIDEFVRIVGLENKTDTTDISRQTNGDQAACNITTLTLEFSKVSAQFAIIRWTNFHTADHRELLSWVVNYREAKERNVTMFNARDACGTDVWETADVDPNTDKAVEYIATVLPTLKPFTQYAVYVQTYTISSATRGAVSNIGYFKTLPTYPSQAVDIKVESLKPGELYITWKPPNKPNGNVTHYYVYWQPVSLNPKQFEIRNYCENRLQTYNKSVKTEQDHKNKSFVDGSCCSCPETKKEQINEDERKFQIHFENFLQNSIYRIKDDSDSSLKKKKRKREAPQVGSATTMPNPGLHPSMGEGIMDQLHRNGTANGTGIGLLDPDDLDAWYPEDEEEIVACHGYEEPLSDKYCSNRAITSARTQPSPTADVIYHKNITTEDISHINFTSEILIHWPQPQEPNGLIVAYDLELRRVGVKDLKPDKFCITQLSYRKQGGYSLPSLPPGNWSYKIRATSLAGYGPWTPDLYFYVPHFETKEVFPVGLVAGVVMVGVGIIVVVVVALVCYVNRKRRIPNHNGLYASINPDYWGAKEVYVPDEWEVDRDKVELLKELGQGSFGMVYEGIAKCLNEKEATLKVAVKTVNEKASLKDRIEFLHEASIMKAFNCNHVVKLLGVVSIGQPTLVIMELMSNGDLKSFLRLHRPDYEGNDGRKPPTLKQILQMAGEIADGMAYLAKEKFVHRDLAARNCMVSENRVVKIGDFGMTRDIYETDYYRKGGKGLLPVRWMAPESLRDGVFSSKSDVWSYGVVMWEMATLAAQPYQGFANEQVLKFVVDGNIMEKPEHCPDRFYNMMVNCWKYTPRQRPKFVDIIEELVPDLDPSFRDDSFFFSELNTAPEVEEEEAEEEVDNNEEGGAESGAMTPLTASPQRVGQTTKRQRDHKGGDLSGGDFVEDADLHMSQADLKSSLSSLSYKSHSPSPPLQSSLLQEINQNCRHSIEQKEDSVEAACQCENGGNGSVGHICGTSGGGDRTVRKPCDVIKTNNSTNTAAGCDGSSSNGAGKKAPPIYCSSSSDSTQRPQQRQWSQDSTNNPTPPPGVSPQSDEGSKGSTKSSNGLNGLANGHIPRLVMPDATC